MPLLLRSSLLAVLLASALAGCGYMEAFNADLYDVSADDTAAPDGVGDDDDDNGGPGPGPAGDDDDDDATGPTGDDDDDDSTTTPPCVAPDLWDLGAAAPVAGTFNPVYVGVSMDGIVDNGDIVDMVLDGVDASAWLQFTFYDANANVLCAAIFDASEAATPSAGWPTSSGGVLFEAWEISLVANTGFTDCLNLGAGYGTTDVRTWVANRSWGIGYGEMIDVDDTLAPAVNAQYPGTWATDWAPYVFSQYVHIGANPKATEAGYAFRIAHTCYETSLTGGVLSKPTAGPLSDYVSGGAWSIFPMSAI